ncbi:MAG: PEP-CTERM sorting domain-containing protein [Desulfopila sp.]|jgi:hypothetical protein|nr:PEP-CTERM sorting domain-containing protein [Desulfopila sp.]
MKSVNKRIIGTISIGLGLSLLASQSVAAPIVIADTYIGGNPTHSSYVGADVIGDDALFDVSKMEVSFDSPNTMTVDIFSQYFDNIGKFGTELGDLFISTDGYSGDGEDWEYVLKLDDYTDMSGDLNLYEVVDGDIILSSAPSGYIYRAGQEVQYDATGQTSLATGSWGIFNNGTTSDLDDYIRFVIAYDFGDVSEFGFHWTMTCANDVIEGGAPAPVPEPASALLFGAGLAGLAGLYRRKR